MSKKITVGFWILIGVGIVLIIIYLLGQTMAIVDYDFAVSIGLQEPEEDITAVGVASNKGFGFGDTVFYIPLFIAGILGMLKRRKIGLYAMAGAMAVTAYWPIVCLSTLFYAKNAPGFHFNDYASYSIILSTISAYGLWGFWFVIKNSGVLTKGKNAL